MQYNLLPGTDLNVSRVCLGTMTWGEQTDKADAHRQLDLAVAHGINFIDTAEMYPVPPRAETQGRTETILGEWLARQPRDRYIIASKVAGPGRRDWLRGGRTELTKANITEAVNESLKRLRTDYIDLYQIHWPDRAVPMFGKTMFVPREEPFATPIIEQVEAMDALVRAGKIRYWGLSNETTWGVCEYVRVARLHGLPQPVTIQNVYSLVSRKFDEDLAEACHREKLALLAYSPLAGGALTGKYRNGAFPPGARYTLFPDFGTRFRKPMVAPAIEAYHELAVKVGVPLTQLAIGFVLSRWHTGAAIIGASKLEQLEENLRYAEAPPLDEATLAEIDRIHERYPSPAY
ncbi:MAG: aldo/keto reductase [Pseudomonadota bacterium]